MSGLSVLASARCVLVLLCASLAQAAAPRPLGVFVKVDIEDAIAGYPGSTSPTAAQLHFYLQSLYAGLLADPAISGISLGQRWDNIQPTNSSSYDWSYLDDAFTGAAAARKLVQLTLTPGFDTPKWLLSQISSCDPLFSAGSAPADCGKVSFTGFPQQQRADGKVLPLPWNSVYQAAWASFLTQLNTRYGANPAFIAIAIAGPVGASDEMIYPNDQNTPVTQPSGLMPDATWAALIQNAFPTNAAYRNTGQVFIDAWDRAIDTYEKIFSVVTLFLGPDAGNDLPGFSGQVTPHPDNILYSRDCANNNNQLMSCEAKTEILSYFVSVSGPNGKATQTGGMTASVPQTPGDLGVAGVKLLTSLSPAPAVPFSGGADFDHPVSGGNIQTEGCPNPNGGCTGLTVELAAYNAMTPFFYGTPAAGFYGGTPGTATIQYLNVPYEDVQYAQANPCPEAPSGLTGSLSLQDLLNRASHDLLAMANQATVLPTYTCAAAASGPVITSVANAAGGGATIAPNTWVAIKGQNLAAAGDTRIWQTSDFTGGQMPTQLDQVSVTVNGKSAYVYYISPAQINVLTPPDALTGSVQVVVTYKGAASEPFTAQAQALSPAFFQFNGGPYVAATHADGSLVGATSLYPGASTPAQPGETVVLYANGFGPTSVAVVSGSVTQSGTLSPPPVVTIGGTPAKVVYAALISPGLFQFNVVVPPGTASGDNAVTATENGVAASPAVLLTIKGSAAPTAANFYVAPNGSDSWSGTLAAPNPAGSDGPLATFDRARAMVQSINKTGLTRITVQFRGGAYFLPATEMFTAADSGSATLQIVYENYPGETPVFSGGMQVGNWTNVGGNTWKTALPPSTQYFENLFYNGVRRLRPRLGGALGTYLRNAGPIYLNAPGPPAQPPDANCPEYFPGTGPGTGWECFDRFQYNAGDPIAGTWKNLAPPTGNHCNQPAGNPALAGDIELVNFEQYSVSKLRISCIDTTNRIVYLTGPTATEADHPTSHGYISGHRYLIENVQDALAVPGQWFLDRSATPWTLTYLSNPGENPNTDAVIVPQLTQLLVASNLQYVTFQGLTFEHDNYTMPSGGYNGDAEIIAAVSFQNSQHVTIDSVTVAHTSGSGMEFISCIDKSSPNWCVTHNTGGVAANVVIQNSAIYDVASDAIRVGTSGNATDTNANVPQFNTVQNTVVEGYGRVYPSSKGITQGQGHDNLYTHNDVYDGYKGAIKVCYCANSDVNPPFTNNNVISFNHVYNLFQGIMNDSGSIYFGVGTPSPPSSGTGNRMLNNKVHDVTDASVMDSDGYGGDGLYADDFSGQVDMENNLVYRVSGHAISFSGPRAGPNQSSTVRNNILAYARLAMLNAYDPYSFTSVPPSPMFFTASNNLMYFDRSSASNPAFYVQGGCVYAGETYTAYQQWNSNLYWRVGGGFATDSQAFRVQQNADANDNCGGQKTWTFYTFSGWQQLGEDAQSVVQDPGFANPAYPADDFSLPKGSPGAGFIPFDPSQAGRTNPVIQPPAVPATFPTKTFNPATDY